MRTKTKMVFAVIAVAAFSFNTPRALNAQGRGGGRGPAREESETTKAIKKAADGLGMLRGVNRMDAINTMEFWANGTTTVNGQAAPTDVHVSLGYDPPGMRVEMTRTVNGSKQQTITEVADKYSWNESQVGGGLVPGKGTAIPDMNAFKERYLALWILPYGAIKGALAAEDNAKMAAGSGGVMITFPLTGPLAGTTETITLDSKGMVSKVVTKSDNPMLTTETEYSNYADLGEIPSDVMIPGRIVETRGGKPYLDIKLTKDDPNNPYFIFPVPDSVKAAK